MNLGQLLRTHWDRSAALACAIGAVVALTVGWVRLSGTPYVAEQLVYLLSGGVAAVILTGFAVALWLSADLRDEWRQLDSIDAALRDLMAGGALLPPPAPRPEVEPRAETEPRPQNAGVGSSLAP